MTDITSTRESQCSPAWKTGTIEPSQQARRLHHRLNVVRPGRPEQSVRLRRRRQVAHYRLNVVRPGRPEQFVV